MPKSWQDDECFIICGGPSVSGLDLGRLAGRRVIAVNSSAFTYPDADFLLFTDKRWWTQHGARVGREFRGDVVTITPMRPSRDYLLLDRQRSGGLAIHPRRLALWHTTVCAAINLAVNLGVRAGNLLGLDGKDEKGTGRSWHHAPHPWTQNPNRYRLHGEALVQVASHLEQIGVPFYNANPDSAHQMFPHRSYAEMTR